MLRRLFTILSGLSLSLFVATCALWVASYSHWCGVTITSDPEADTHQNCDQDRYDVRAILGKLEFSLIQLRGIEPVFQLRPRFRAYCHDLAVSGITYSDYQYWFTSQGRWRCGRILVVQKHVARITGVSAATRLQSRRSSLVRRHLVSDPAGLVGNSPQTPNRSLRVLRLRPPRHTQSMPGMRDDSGSNHKRQNALLNCHAAARLDRARQSPQARNVKIIPAGSALADAFSGTVESDPAFISQPAPAKAARRRTLQNS
jgi:hypothetical protein